MYATPWEDPRLINFVLLSGLIGLAAFCASYAWNVWRRRNKSAVSSSGNRAYAWLRGAFSILAACGLLAVLIAAALREVCPPTGQIVAERLFTVRAREGYQVLSMTGAVQVTKGDVVAQLNSPPVAAESAEFTARISEEQAECAKAGVLALQLDEELVRRHQNAISRQQQFRASRDQILPARNAIALLKVQGELDRRDKLAHLEDERQTVLGDLKIASARQILAREDLRRVELLGRQSVVAAGQLDEARTRLAAVVHEIGKLESRQAALDNEIKQVAQSKSELASECDRQLKSYAQELDRIDSALADATSDEARLELILANDRERAEQVKMYELARLSAKVKQSAAKQAGARQTLEISAPFSGNVVYRERSPNTAELQDALLVLGDDSGLVMRLRLPIDQVASLEAAGEVEAELAGPSLIPYFATRYSRHEPLEQRPGYAIVELACRLPAEAVRDVVHGRTVVGRLMWRPPLWTIDVFAVGVVSLVVGLIGWFAVGRLAIPNPGTAKPAAGHSEQQRTTSQLAKAALPHSVTTAAHGARELEYGELAASLRMLGDRFRTSIIDGRLDEDLIAAVEWALDRHQARAVQLLSEVVGDDELLGSSVAELLDAAHVTGGGRRDSHHLNDRLTRRISRILTTIAPALFDDVLADN